MTNVQVRDVPDEVVARLKARAGRRGQSLQRYLLDVLTTESAVVGNEAILADAARDRSGHRVRPGDAAKEVRRGRAEREARLDTGP